MKKKSITENNKKGAGRRRFLRDGVAAGAAAAFAPAMMSASRVEVRENAPRDVANDVDASAFAEARAFELDEITVAELQEGMKSGKFTARSITEKYLARIEAVDARGPALRSVIETNPEASGDCGGSG